METYFRCKIDNKFINFVDTDEYQVLTDNGYEDFSGIGKTIKYSEYNLELDNGTHLVCADKHILIDEFDNNIFCEDLIVGQYIKTIYGFNKVISNIKTNKKSNMYDLVNVTNKKFYTNDILSHNTSVVTIHACWKFTFREYNNSVVLANKKTSATRLLSRVQTGFESLPSFLQTPMKYYNKGDMEGTNGSRIVTAATSADSVSGESANDLYVDECSKIHRNIWDEFWVATYPILSSAKRKESISVILLSTPLGDNHWKKLVNEAALEGTKNWNGFKLQTVTYKDIPERNNKKWVNNQIKILGDLGHRQENLAEFVTQTDIFISGKILEDIHIKKATRDTYIKKCLKKYIDSISSYYKPIEGHKYVIGLDPSEMRENSVKGENDNIGIQIIDVTDVRTKFKQVLTINFEENFNYLETPLVLDILGKYYNEALIIGENNKCKQILNDLRDDYLYPNIYIEDWNKKDVLGYRLTKGNKPVLAKILKFLIENDLFEINDDDTLFELKKFTRSLKAMPGYNDGLVTSLFACISFMLQTQDVIESLFGTEEDGVYIRTGKELLQISYQNSDNEDNDELSDHIFRLNNDDESVVSNEEINEVLQNNGFYDEFSEGIIIL